MCIRDRDISQTKPEEEAAMQFLTVILIQVNHDEEQDKISNGFVEPVSYTHLAKHPDAVMLFRCGDFY